MSDLTFGRRLKQLRTAAGLSQSELGRRAKVAANTISQFEAGKRSPQFWVVVRLAEVLDVSINDFVTSEDEVEEGELVAALV